MAEAIYDISEETQAQVVPNYQRNLGRLSEYVKESIVKYSNDQDLQLFFGRITVGAHESGVDRQVIHLLGSLTALDTVDRDLKSKSINPSINRDDWERYQNFSQRFLANSRFTEIRMDEGGIIHPDDALKYIHLLRETGGPKIDITPFTNLLRVKGRDRFLTSMEECATELSQGNPISGVIETVFMGGVFPVLTAYTLKHSTANLTELINQVPKSYPTENN